MLYRGVAGFATCFFFHLTLCFITQGGRSIMKKENNMNYTHVRSDYEVPFMPNDKKGLEIISFNEKDDKQRYSDKYLAQVFRRIVREETIYKVFYDGSVRNTNDFINFFRGKEKDLFFAEYNGKEVGFFWLKPFMNNSAFISYCFYKDFWGDKAMQISKECIEYLLNHKDEHGQYTLDILMGLTPASNKLAIQFLLKNGMSIMGRIPNMLYDVNEDAMVDGIFSFLQRNSSKSLLNFTSLFFLH